MKAHSLQVLGTSVLLVLLSATTIAAPITAQTQFAPETFDCSAVTEIPLSECQALVALYNSTDGAGWTSQSGWLMTNTPCLWYGVTCDNGHVNMLDLSISRLGRYPLPGNRLRGRIPPELGNLANLHKLYLSHNQLGGSIPSELCNLANLQGLYLSYNQLSGGIPSCLGNLANLQGLELNSNQLGGSIPSELCNLANLQGLYLFSNQLSGGIPSCLGNLANLLGLGLSENQLSGSIPPELGNLANLWTLRLRSNQLSGSIPPQLGSLANLGELDLRSNQLSGSIPPQLGSLANLRELDLRSNQLSGGIPPQLGNLALLESLFLTSNQLSGGVPREFGNLLNLWMVDLGFNQLSGPLPQSLTNVHGMYYFWFDTDLLCAPANAAFQGWLAGISDKPADIRTCESLVCSAVTEIPLSECQALVALYETTNGPGWVDNTGWFTTDTPCGWYGVLCDTGHVIELRLISNQLSGGIPSQLGKLASLKWLDLSSNQLRGLLPQELTNLTELFAFYFDTNLLCAPGNAAFQTWLAGIYHLPPWPAEIKICNTCNLPVVMR